VLLLWNTLLCLLWPLLVFYPPFRGSLRQRLGQFSLGDYDPTRPGLKVLINAVSAGEVVAITPFIRQLKLQRPECQVVLLTTTQSGQDMARSKLLGSLDMLAYFPLIDLPWVARRYLDRLRPELYITTEAEIWPNIQAQCRRRGIPVVLANARIYLHNKRGLRRVVMRRLYELCDLLICQDERQREQFTRFGFDPQRLVVSGNTKFDFELPEWSEQQLEQRRREFAIVDVPVVVAGSTHEGEEELLLRTLVELRKQPSGVRLILAPRHIERAGAVKQAAQALGFATLLLAEQQAGADWNVLVIDRYGVLVDFYRLADAVVLGGTFHSKVGGHNILEATALGKPVLVGPHTFSITSQLEMLAAVDGVVQVGAADELARELARLLADPPRREAIGEAARRATLANRGSALRAVNLALACLSGPPAGI
jgi:3-deoxy-D-manno-octulosonic-acid transferase